MIKTGHSPMELPSSPKKTLLGPRLSVQRDAVFSLLKQQAADNREYFETYKTKSTYYQRILDCCVEIDKSIELISELVEKIQVVSKKCDFDEKTPGNGFRSLICVCDMVLLHLVSILKKCTDTRNSGVLFRSTTICKDLENYVAILRFMVLSFQQVVVLIDTLEEGSLFPKLDGDYSVHNGILKAIESMDASCFYGRSFGFQFVPSVTLIFQLIGIVLATYSLSWGNGSAAFGSLLSSGRYLLNPEERAKQIIKVTREADIEFCRDFWNLSEIPPPKLFCPTMEVHQMCHVPMCGPLELVTNAGHSVVIPEPSAHGPPSPIPIKILCAKHRIGLSSRTPAKPLCPNLLIHCHGGGYVATTSKSHETYLRMWAKHLDCPIVSIDYSLSPEFPFPRPTEEALYTYAWILANPTKMGWNGERVILVGDSAGGNLIVSLSVRLAELDVARMPDELVPIYTPFLFQYLPSPSRVLSFKDPLLHMGVVIRCAAAYTGICPEGTKSEISRRDRNASQRSHKSLMEYVDEVKARHLVNPADYSVGFRREYSIFQFGNQSILSLVNLSMNRRPTAVAALPLGEQSPIEEVEVAEEALQIAEEPPAADVSPTNGQNGQHESEEEEEEEEERKVDSTTVHIDQDSSHISLSVCNYDHTLIDYLLSHPLTMNSTNVDNCGKPPTPAEVAELASPGVAEPADEAPPSRLSALRKSSHRLLSQKISAISGATTAVNAAAAPPAKEAVGVSGDRHWEVFQRRASLSQAVVRTVTTSMGHAFDNITHYIEPETSPIGAADKPKLTRTATAGFYEAAKAEQQEAEKVENCLTELLKLDLPRDHLISPMYTPDELLCKLPPCRFISCHLDPLLDDTITFAKKVRNAGGTIRSIDLLDGLPHGFLNFAPMSDDCYEGARLCMQRIKEGFDSFSR